MQDDARAHADPNAALEARLAGIKIEVEKMIGQLHGKSAPRVRLESFADKAGALVKAHPIASAATALALGYFLVRVIRR